MNNFFISLNYNIIKINLLLLFFKFSLETYNKIGIIVLNRFHHY